MPTDWTTFHVPFFPTPREAGEFVADLEALTLESPRHKAKIMMHQCHRLVTIADDMENLRRGHDSLPLLFLLVCAENISKLHSNFEGEGQSRAFVRRFFENHLSPAEKDSLTRGIQRVGELRPTLEHAVDALYEVRCDLVHEGNYWNFHFPEPNTYGLLNGMNPTTRTSIPFHEVRSMIVLGCIRAIHSYAGP